MVAFYSRFDNKSAKLSFPRALPANIINYFLLFGKKAHRENDLKFAYS